MQEPDEWVAWQRQVTHSTNLDCYGFVDLISVGTVIRNRHAPSVLQADLVTQCLGEGISLTDEIGGDAAVKQLIQQRLWSALSCEGVVPHETIGGDGDGDGSYPAPSQLPQGLCPLGV